MVLLVCLGLTISPFAQDSEEEEPDSGTPPSQPSILGFGLDSQEFPGLQPYIAEDFANFEVYNATLEAREGGQCRRAELAVGGAAAVGRGLEKEVTRSPTASSCTSGYFSHSASNATLSDAVFTGSDSSEQLSANSRDPADLHDFSPSVRRSSLQNKSALGGEPSLAHPGPRETASPPPPPPPSACAPNCSDGDDPNERPSSPSPSGCVLSVSQEFTDFKGADEGPEDGDPGLCTGEGWRSGEAGLLSGQRDRGEPPACHMHNGKEPAPPRSPEPQCQGDALPPSSPSHPPPATPALAPNPAPRPENPTDSSSGDEAAPVAQLPDWMAPGERVWVGGKGGMVHYVGGVEFAEGIWVGVQLDAPAGE